MNPDQRPEPIEYRDTWAGGADSRYRVVPLNPDPLHVEPDPPPPPQPRRLGCSVFVVAVLTVIAGW